MKHTIIHVDLHLDDTQWHGSSLDKSTGEAIDFNCRPTLKGFLGQLEKLSKYFPGRMLTFCYKGRGKNDLSEDHVPIWVSRFMFLTEPAFPTSLWVRFGRFD